MRVRRSLFGLSALICVLAITAIAGAATYRVSLDSLGGEGNNASWLPSLSGDGGLVAFISLANDLVPNDTNGVRDIFIRDFVGGMTTRVSVASDGTQGNGDSWGPSVSANGRYVAFSSSATNLVPGDANGRMDVFVRDLESGTTTRVSVPTGGGEANGDSRTPSISSDGRYVAFASDATNLVVGDGNGCADIFVHDAQTSATEWVSIGLPATGVSGASRDPSISGDGSFVAFSSSGSHLVANDTNLKDDVFLRDRQGGVTVRVSIGLGGAQANGASQDPAISSNGQFVAFKSYAANLVTGDTNLRCDIFVYDRSSGAIGRASVSSGGAEGAYDSVDPAISSDGQLVAFASRCTNFSGYDTNGSFDIFVRDRTAGITQQVTGTPLAEANNHSWGPVVVGTAESPMVAFWSEASNLVPGDSNEKPDVFIGVPSGAGGGDYGYCYGLTADGGIFAGMYTVYVPININLSTDVAGIDFKLLFDPKVVQLVDVTTSNPPGDTTPVPTNNWQLEYNINNEEGWVAVSMANDQPMTPPDVAARICYLIFAATAEASATTTNLSFEYVRIYDYMGMPLPLCEGGGGGPCRMYLELAECPHPGDVNRDQTVDSADAILLLQAAVGMPEPVDWPYDWPPLACNDWNGDGIISSGDAVLVLAFAAAGGDLPFPEPDWFNASAVAGDESRSVSLPATAAEPGGTVSVPIMVDDATGIAGADFSIYFDPALLEAVAVSKTPLTSAFLLEQDTTTPGRVGITMARATGIASGAGALATIEFRSLGPTGSSALQFGECKLYDQTPVRIPATAASGAIQVVSVTGFSDVPADFWAADEIVACFHAGVVSGYPDSTYQPAVVVPRDQMAAFVARAVAGGEASVPVVSTTPSFADVPQLHWAFKYVEYCTARAVVGGFDDGLYHPDLDVNRGQMATFIARAMVAPGGDAAIPAPVPPDSFPDVTATNEWAGIYAYVEYLADEGVVTGYQDGLYHPADPVTRDQMAVYIARAFDLM